jgi:hypothetical protein
MMRISSGRDCRVKFLDHADLGPGFTSETQEVGRVVIQKSRVRWMDTQLSLGKPV